MSAIPVLSESARTAVRARFGTPREMYAHLLSVFRNAFELRAKSMPEETRRLVTLLLGADRILTDNEVGDLSIELMVPLNTVFPLADTSGDSLREIKDVLEENSYGLVAQAGAPPPGGTPFADAEKDIYSVLFSAMAVDVMFDGLQQS